MSDKKDHYIKDYTKVLNKSRKRRKRIPDRRHILVAVGAVVVFTSAVLAGRAVVARRQQAEEQEAVAADQESVPETTIAIESTLSAEEQQRQQILKEKQEVVDSYNNLGLVQVAGYLNVRESPGSNGKIIGKLQQNSACEILDTDGEWCHITSGGIDYYNRQ